MNDETTQTQEAEQTNDKEVSGGTIENTSNGLPIIEQAKAEATRLEKIYNDLKAENDRYERFKANEMLGGKSTGADQTKPVEKDDPRDYADKLISGKLN